MPKSDDKSLGCNSTAECLSLTQEVEGSNPSIPKVVFADDTKIEELEEWVDRVLTAIGHPEAWVSDESMVWDFMPSVKEVDQEWLNEVKRKMCVPVNARDKIWELAERYKIAVEKQHAEWQAHMDE